MSLIVQPAKDSIITHDLKFEFKTDVKNGLEKKHKQISSKYLYDEIGSELFNQITRHSDYYLTQCEIEILNNYKNLIASILTHDNFNLVDLGPGEAIKTEILIQEFLQRKLTFDYIPIDISKKYLETLILQLKQKMPILNMTAIHSDYFNGLNWLAENSKCRNVVLFLGSSIGNFNLESTFEFLRHLWDKLNDEDLVLLGFDMCKDIEVLKRAYDDTGGITRNFNLNLLQRINRELGADFSLDNFYHHAIYNAQNQAMESYLVSLIPQKVKIHELKQVFFFEEFEPIHVEFSYKYRLSQIHEYANQSGFKVIAHFSDKKRYFIDTLWQVVKKDSAVL